jgi:phosphatidylglycerophosphate synthase
MADASRRLPIAEGQASVNPSSAPARSQAVVVCGAAQENTLRMVGGLTLLERLLRQLSELDSIDSILVLKRAELSLPPPSNRVRKTVAFQNASGTDAWAMLRDARARLQQRFIVVAADLLIDQRLLAWLAAQSSEVMLTSQAGAPGDIAACLQAGCLDAAGPEAAGVKRVAVGSLPSYWETMHGEVPLHLHRVASDLDAEKAWQILLDHVQRRTLELPARYFDPTFENLLVRRLAPTKVTANQVTLVTTVLGFVVCALYFVGWLRVGVLLAIFVEVLDGVDGKLARVTRTTSRVGEYEHVFDFFYENSWYLGLAIFLARNGNPFAWTAGLLMIGFDLIDNIVYSVMDVKWGRSLDNASPFLARFRLIAGRRNIYTWLFLPGFFLGTPAISFYLSVIWAGITATIHAAWGIIEALRMMRTPFARPRD